MLLFDVINFTYCSNWLKYDFFQHICVVQKLISMEIENLLLCIYVLKLWKASNNFVVWKCYLNFIAPTHKFVGLIHEIWSHFPENKRGFRDIYLRLCLYSVFDDYNLPLTQNNTTDKDQLVYLVMTIKSRMKFYVSRMLWYVLLKYVTWYNTWTIAWINT